LEIDTNPIIERLGRRLRLAVIGGGPGSFIGAAHRAAARLDNRFEIVAGALSSDADRSRQAGCALGLAPDRTYGNATELLDAEAMRDDGADAVAVMTPNDSHHEYSVAALDRGFDVICDKPMTNTLAEAQDLHRRVRESGLVFCLTHNYTGYPMVRQARAMIEDGQLGEIRFVQVEYVQGARAHEQPHQSGHDLPWRHDPARGGPSLVLGDIGSHAHNLGRFVTGLEILEVAAEVGAIVPNRRFHDFAGAMLRFEGGARGNFWVTQAAPGFENSLKLRVCGSEGSLEWAQEIPTKLAYKPVGKPTEVRTSSGPGTLPLAARATRMIKGHPDGYLEGFATLYSDAAEAIAARRSGTPADPLAMHFPNSEDGLLGVKFADAALASSAANGAWTSTRLDDS
jgi:predicted dehydrogenase